MDTKQIFSAQLQEAVKYSSINYSELAKKLGITKATMSMYKHGKALPSLETFTLLCDILDVSADFLLGKKEF
ncbi:MAG: helix-turn-helix transcriptional regulator [Clostridiales bacterium]|nr:helix-turn-helix transcriptional regulator [Clostridiales bacterium]